MSDLIDPATFAEEFPQIKDQIYLDHAGTTLFAKSQIVGLNVDLYPAGGKILGNPHSHNPSSRLTADIVDQVRLRVLQFFGTTADEYAVVFTSGATAGLKLVAENFSFRPNGDGGVYVYTQESHTSVFGARGVAADRGAAVFCIDAHDLVTTLSRNEQTSSAVGHPLTNPPGIDGCGPGRAGNGLFAYPAQCNFSGRKFPLDWVKTLRTAPDEATQRRVESLLTPANSVRANDVETGSDNSVSAIGRDERCSKLTSARASTTMPEKWFVLLDAASFVSTNPLALSSCLPDFVTISFYKMFGFPTGIGAVLIKKSAEAALIDEKRYFGGGTVAVSLTRKDVVRFRPQLHDRFEDGTVSFLAIISLLRGFDTLARLGGNMSRIQNHVFSLVESAYKGLTALKHGNGSPVVEIYGVDDLEVSAPPSGAHTGGSHPGPTSGSGLTKERHGGALAFNVLRPDGTYVGFSEVSKILELCDIHVRTGCFCNPGACQKYLRMTDERILSNHEAGHVCGDDVDLIDGQPTGCIRISFGYMSRRSDVEAFLGVMSECFVDTGSRRHQQQPEAKGAKMRQDAVEGKVANEAGTRDATANTEPKEEDANEEVDRGHQVSQQQRARVTDLLVYPVKSCAAFRPTSGTFAPGTSSAWTIRWPVTDSGFAYDRTWMITDGRGVVLSQKREGRLCFIEPRIDVDSGLLWLHVDGMPDVSTPLDPPDEDSGGVRDTALICQSKVCGDRVDVLDCGDEISEWLRNALCRDDEPRLLRMNPRFQRLSNKNLGAGNNNATKLSLANEAQFLVISRASVRALMDDLRAVVAGRRGGDHLEEEELINRFRPNIVIDGLLPYAEESVSEFRFESTIRGSPQGQSHAPRSTTLTLQNVGACSRCQMVCIDQKTGEKTKEPLVTLAATRGPKIPFGVHCCRRIPSSSPSGYEADSFLELHSTVIVV